MKHAKMLFLDSANVSLSCKESFIARYNDLIYRMCNKMKNNEYHTAGTI